MKPNKSNLITLNVIFVVCLIVANIVTAKVVDTGLYLGSTPILIPGAALTYAATFLCTDIIGELYGREEANRAVWRGFLAQFVARLWPIYVRIAGMYGYFTASASSSEQDPASAGYGITPRQ